MPDAVRGCSTRGDSNRPVEASGFGCDQNRAGHHLADDPFRVAVTANTAWPYAAKAPVMLPARARATLAIAPEAVGTVGPIRS